MPVDSHLVTHPEWPDRYGVTPAGAVLIRPDGHVAWRSEATPRPGEPAPHEQLPAALKAATGSRNAD